ncbi:hypothetical protein HZ996_02555 [Cryomorphaceae bacterium]|nr:hypothetical protein HZ996_02555 [Cryomorphaceae bacterium]
MKKALLILSLTYLVSVQAQDTHEPDSTTVSTIDGTVNEVLNIISGEPDKVRNLEQFRMLFRHDATFRALTHAPDGNRSLRTFNLEEFARIVRNFYDGSSFLEYELKKTVNEYNGIAQVFQGYQVESPRGKEKGVNSYQLYFDGTRWWITSILWVSDRNGVELPEEYR